MLSSRYLHLHEALGLGPMWLQQGAKVVPPATAINETAAAPKVHIAPPISTTKPTRTNPPISHARAATMAAIGSHTKSNAPTPSRNPSTNASPTLPTLTNSLIHTLPSAPVVLMVISICPAPEDYASEQLFSGEVGQLLDKMLAAIGLQPQHVHKTSWLASTTFNPNPSAEELDAAQPRLSKELQQAAPKAILFLGQFFTQASQHDRLMAFSQGLPMFTVPHPARLLRQPHLKAEAWDTLQQLQKVL